MGAFCNNIKSIDYDTFDNKDNNDAVKQKTKFYSLPHKCIYTLILVVGYLVNPMATSILSPIIVDLKYMFRTSIATVSYVNTFLGIGFLIGTLFGFGLKYVDRHNLFILITLIQTISFAVIPLMPELWLLFLGILVLRIGIGIFECGSYVWMISLWKQHYYAVNHFAHFMFSFGIMLGPIFDSPYVMGDVTKFNPDQTSLNETERDQINYAIDRRGKLAIPFLITAAISAIMPIGLIVMWFVNKYQLYQDPIKSCENETDILESREEVSTFTKYVLVGVIAMSLCNQCTLENGHVAYAPTFFQYIPLGISAKRGAEILTVFSGCHAIGRLLSIFESIKVSATNMIMIHTALAYFAQFIIFFGQNSENLILIGNILLGLGFSSLQTSYFNLTEEYLKLTESITSLFLLTSNIMVIILPVLIGPLIDKLPQIFLYVEFSMQTVNIILFIFILFVIKK